MYVPDEDNYIVDGENYAPPRPPEPSKKKTSFPKKKLIVIGGALLIGFCVYLVSTLIFGGEVKGQNNSGVSLTLDLENKVVGKLYGLISYGREGQQMNKYLKEQRVTLSDFSNYEKFYYALSLLNKNDLYDTKVTRDNKKIYAIAEKTVIKLMEEYFGSKVTYLKQGTIPVMLPFKQAEGNFVELVYNASDQAFTSVITKKEISQSKAVVPSYLTSIESATELADGSIQLIERVIYLTSIGGQESVQYSIYRDRDHTMPIVSNKVATISELTAKPIEIKDYIKKANIITYTFKKQGDGYYFYQSQFQE